MKIPVYFRTRNDLASLQEFLMKLNKEIRTKVGWGNASWISMTTKYTEANPTFNNIPKSKPSDKKYMAVIHANKEKMERMNLGLEEKLSGLDGIELVRRGDDGPKYKGETTKAELVVTKIEQFTELVSVFDKAFGHGNWHVRGPRKNIRKLIDSVQTALENPDNVFLLNYVRQFKNGVPLRITVNRENVDLNKYLFKVKLKA